MRLADFIETNAEAILSEWDSFAQTLRPAANKLSVAALRDHAAGILRAAVQVLRSAEVGSTDPVASPGPPQPAGRAPTAAQTHGNLRASDGFTLQQMLSEYKTLRASVIRRWAHEHTPGPIRSTT